MGNLELKKGMNSFKTLSWLLLFVCALGFGLPAARSSGMAPLFDSTFQVGGGADDNVYALVLQPDGKLLVGGSFSVISGKTNAHLARLYPNGHLDPSFGAGTDDVVYKFCKLQDGKVMVAGAFNQLQGFNRQCLGRLLTNGIVDTNFDASGSFETNEVVVALCEQPDGKIVTASTYYLRARFMRFLTNGTLDTSFATTNYTSYVNCLMPYTNGTILVGGAFTVIGSTYAEGIALLHSDGQVDTNFPQLLDVSSSVISLTKLTNGNILVGGVLQLLNPNRREMLAQLSPSWNWDTNFQTDSFETNFLGEPYASAVIIQPDGKIVVGGAFDEIGGYWRRNLIRFDSQGHVDPCFDPGPGLGLRNSWPKGALALALQPDGDVLVGGSFDSTEWAGVANLARLLPTGECGATRIYLIPYPNSNAGTLLGTTTSGGTNTIQVSTNLTDWSNLDTQPGPYLYLITFFTNSATYYRILKSY